MIVHIHYWQIEETLAMVGGRPIQHVDWSEKH